VSGNEEPQTPPGHPPPTSPLEVRLGEMGPAPAQAPCEHLRGPSTRASSQSRAINRWTDPPSQGVARLTAARHTGKVTGGEHTKRWGVLESGDIAKVHPLPRACPAAPLRRRPKAWRASGVLSAGYGGDPTVIVCFLTVAARGKGAAAGHAVSVQGYHPPRGATCQLPPQHTQTGGEHLSRGPTSPPSGTAHRGRRWKKQRGRAAAVSEQANMIEVRR
jgi:hypothetical protein